MVISMRPLVCLCAACWLVAGVLGCSKGDTGRVNSLGLLDLDGRPFALWKPNQGAITVVLFTRTDCPIANRCAPEIHRLYETYHRQGVEFFLVYVDPREPPEAIHRHMKEYDYHCQGLRDPRHTLVAHCN